EMLNRPQYKVVPVQKAFVIIFCVTAGYLEDIPREAVQQVERDLFRHMDSVGRGVGQRILKEKRWTPEVEKDVRAMIEDFKKSHPYGDEQKTSAPAERKQPAAPTA